ncbi:hypothetical protein DPMN_011487 [Dreissena polymorpha]|uniref:Uncharacterized protein n=1 Tax=Dreissena polymorpha TaxID=45954 RepID=A0A9D4N458_DREPO|nr:hypothetical protein DPMN_011487 [Dreissena polymorpha]
MTSIGLGPTKPKKYDPCSRVLTRNKMFGANRPTDQQTNGPTDQQTNRPTDRQGKNNMSPTTIVGDIKMPRPLGGHVFPPTGTIFKLIQDIIGTNHLTKFHDDRTINVASRVLKRKNAPPPDIFRTNLLSKFHEDRTINVASRVLTRKHAPPPGSHVFQPMGIIF